MSDKQQEQQIPSEISQKINEQQKQTMEYIRDYFYPSYNLYQKMYVQEKIKCYDTNKSNPEQYYKCIQKVDSQMGQNSQLLSQKFGVLDNEDQDCQDKCKESFIGQNEHFKNCMDKCIVKVKEGSINIYKNFYQKTISHLPEYKNVNK